MRKKEYRPSSRRRQGNIWNSPTFTPCANVGFILEPKDFENRQFGVKLPHLVTLLRITHVLLAVGLSRDFLGYDSLGAIVIFAGGCWSIEDDSFCSRVQLQSTTAYDECGDDVRPIDRLLVCVLQCLRRSLPVCRCKPVQPIVERASWSGEKWETTFQATWRKRSKNNRLI